MNTVVRYWIAVIAGALCFGCTSVPRIVSEYKIDIQQGNVLTQEMVAQLKPGLTQDQVRYILGTPILTDIFHANRWDYVYSFRQGNSSQTEVRKFSVFFDETGKLSRVSGDVAAMTTSDVEETPENKMRELDLGSVDGAAPPPPEEKGLWRKIVETIGF